MKKLLLIFIFILPLTFAQAAMKKEPVSTKPLKKEIAVSHLPKATLSWISQNLPHAKITKVWKQKDKPGEKYIVAVTIKTKYHTIIFNKKGEFVRVLKK
jgi:hypothetical protein